MQATPPTFLVANYAAENKNRFKEKREPLGINSLIREENGHSCERHGDHHVGDEVQYSSAAQALSLVCHKNTLTCPKHRYLIFKA